MMFRRRTTDQVYATLQQVQRRITEQGGGNAPTGSAPPAGARPLAGIAPPPLQTNQHLGAPSYAPPATAPALRPSAFPGGPDDSGATPARALHLSMQVGTVLLLLWLGTLGAAYGLGMRQGTRNGTDSVENRPTAVETPPAKPTDPEAPAPGKRQGDSIFVLTSTPTFTPALKQQWQVEVDRLNGVMKQNEAKGWKPYFALREPENGGLQFVFGQANGRFGIDRAQFEELARQLAAPKAKGGGGYASAKWLAVD